MIRILCLLIGYCFGCLQTAYLAGRVFHVDLRTKGSGNLGFTNTLRVLGKKAGLIVFLIDMAKATAAFFLCRALFPDLPLAGFYGGFGAVLGHDFPFYLKFKGGKGISSMIGTIVGIGFTMYPLVVPICAACGILPLISRYISIGSLCFCVSIPLALLVSHAPTEAVVLGLVMSLLAIYKHKENIKRLATGTENRLGKKKGTNP